MHPSLFIPTSGSPPVIRNDLANLNSESIELLGLANKILVTNLGTYGNTLSGDHKLALLELIANYCQMIQGVYRGRYAYGIDTGMGKTESLVALVTAINQLKMSKVSIMICQSKVEGLCELKRKMIAMGVPEEKIGLIHSYNYDQAKLDGKGYPTEEGYASLPSTSIEEHRQFQLVTHNRIRGDGNLASINTYDGQPRSLAVWDESLLASDALAINHKELRKAISDFDIDYEDSQKYSALNSYLKESLAIIRHEQKSQADGNMPTKLMVPEVDPETRLLYKKLISQIRNSKSYGETLATLLDISDSDIRVLHTSQGSGIVSYTISVPRELDNVIILDASWWIRDLQRLDNSIEDITIFAEGIKRYDNVTIHQMLYPSGRASMTEDFSGSRSQRKITKEIAEVIKGIPESEGVLFFTFKKRGNLDFVQVLKGDLEYYGIDTTVTIKKAVKGEPKDVPRINFLTWGSETSLNEYSYCTNVILAGILHRSYIDIGSSILGQQNDLTLGLTNEKIKKIHDSELAHLILQALSRGSCRSVVDSYANPMNAWIIHRDFGIKSLLEKVMTGVKWKPWEEVDTNNRGVILRTSWNILLYLDSLPKETEKISSVDLRKQLGHESNVSDTSWTNAINKAMDQTKRWRKESRSLVRTNEIDEWFPDED